MSTQTAGNARFNACLRTVRGLTHQLAADTQRTHMALLAAARHVTAPRASLVDLDTTWAALADVPGATQTLSRLAPEQYRAARGLEAQARLSPSTGLEQATAAAAQLQQALVLSASELGRQRRCAIADVVVTAATNLGYSLARCDGATTTGIEAWRGHELILIGVDDSATVWLDHAGLVDGTCNDRQTALEDEMARCGVDLIDTRHLPHGLERGGQLIATAAGRDRSSLARGLVLSQERDAEDATPARGNPGSLFAARPGTSHSNHRRVGGVV